MITVAELIDQLQKFPPDAQVYAYEGEIVGVVVVDAKTHEQLGYIVAEE